MSLMEILIWMMKTSYPDLGNNQTQLDKLLTHHNFKLLEHILAELQNHNEMKWNHWTVDDLFPNLLQNPHNLMKHCVVEGFGSDRQSSA